MKISFDAVLDVFPPQLKPLSKGPGKFFCPNCRKTLDERQFFRSARQDKFPSGLLPNCKTCVTMGIDDTDPMTFLPFLKEMDIPYIPKEWRGLLVKKPDRGASILGKYASKMKLNQFKKYRWIDSEKINEEDNEMILAAFRQESESETEAEEKLRAFLSMGDVATPAASVPNGNASPAQYAAMYGLTPETSKYKLTKEEIIQLKLDWGDEHSEDDFLRFEQMFQDMRSSYVILDPVALSNARMICKMTVKMNKYLDIDDVESASKLSRQLDLFIKSANLAPVQQKDRQQSTFSISQLAFLVEKEGGFIPEFYIEQPNDKIDLLLQDLENYTRTLVSGETQLGNMIENAQAILAEDAAAIGEELEEYDDFSLLEKEILGEFDGNGEEDD